MEKSRWSSLDAAASVQIVIFKYFCLMLTEKCIKFQQLPHISLTQCFVLQYWATDKWATSTRKPQKSINILFCFFLITGKGQVGRCSLANNMDMLHIILNILLPPLTIIFLFLFYPIYLFIKLLNCVRKHLCVENVAGKVVLITGASSGIGEVRF